MSSLVRPYINGNGYRWIEMVCACHHPLESQSKALQSLHTILAGIIVLHPQQGGKHLAYCAFPRLISVLISTDVLLNMSLTVLIQVRLHRYVWRLLVGNTYFPQVIVCLAHTAEWVEEFTGLLSFLELSRKLCGSKKSFLIARKRNLL